VIPRVEVLFANLTFTVADNRRERST